MKRLTVLTVVLASLTVITGVYGMNFEHMPELGWRFGYLWALALMVAVPSAHRRSGRGRRSGCERASSGSRTTSSTRSRPARSSSGPASVVKELVENALDAGARSVHVEIEDGGVRLVRVRDDGHGMSRADAEMALERHATSKLRAFEDLQSIATHGFRGEALPSIAAVSELVLRTRAEGEPGRDRGGGRPRPARCTCGTPGTRAGRRSRCGTCSARCPARRKFLRAASTEAAHVAEALTLLALARPGTGFSLQVGRADAPRGAAGRRPRRAPLPALRGEGCSRTSCRSRAARSGSTVRGFVSRPDRPRPARPNLRLFVNGRAGAGPGPLEGRARGLPLARAAGDRGFEAFLFVEVPPHMVDVNVHPAKTEVKFADAPHGLRRRSSGRCGRRCRRACARRRGRRGRGAARVAAARRAGPRWTDVPGARRRRPANRPLWDAAGRRSVARGGGGRAPPLEAPAPRRAGPAPARLHRGERRRRAAARRPAHGPRARALRAAAGARRPARRRVAGAARAAGGGPAARPAAGARRARRGAAGAGLRRRAVRGRGDAPARRARDPRARGTPGRRSSGSCAT